MTLSNFRLAGLAAVAVAAFTACPPPVQPPPPPPGQICEAPNFPTGIVCDSDRACVGGFCDKVNDLDSLALADDPLGCCVRVLCLSNADCADNEKCEPRRGLCVPEDLCDPSQPNGGTCEIDGNTQDCCQPGQLCQYSGGDPLCADQAPPSTNCFVAVGGRPIATGPGDTEAAPAIIRAGEDLQLEAVGTDANGKLIANAQFTWTGANAAGLLEDAVCAAGVCDVTVTATAEVGGGTCDGLVKVYAAPADKRIIVVDATSGLPIDGADVAAVIGGVVTAGTTNAEGAAEFAGDVTAISAFPANHQWHTIVGPPADVIIYTSPLPNEDVVAGVKGTFNFDNVHTTGDIKLGLSGTAISSSITDLNFATIIGEIADYNVELQGITDPGGQVVPLPSGLVIELGANPIKGEYVTFGDEGPNVAWAIGGQVALAEVGPIISGVAAGGGDVNIGSILGGVLPFFARFDHALVTGLNLSNTPRPPPPAVDGEPVAFEAWQFDEEVITPDTLLALSAAYTMPDLPCTPGGFNAGACTAPEGAEAAFATGAVLLTGVIVPGIGLVPLGLTAGLDDPNTDDNNDLADGKLDYDTENAPAKGEAIIDYAPPHDGLEGNKLISVAIALDLNSIADTGGGFGASIITHITDKYGADNAFPQAFLEAQGGDFTPGQDGEFVMTAVGDDADFWRVNFSGGGDVEWNVWFEDPTATFSPGDFHPDPAAAAARFEDADVQGFTLGTGYEVLGPAPATYAELFAFDGKDLDNLLYYLGAWSSEACKPGGLCSAPEQP